MRVAELWRYPVKSLRGERLERIEVLRDGFSGDRMTRVLGADGSHLTGRTVTGLLGLRAGLDRDDQPLIEGEPWDSASARDRIESVAGAGAALAPLGRHFDAAPVLVVTDGAVAALGEDARRLRPNVVVDGVDGLAERDWVGQRLRLGPVHLLVRERCERCVMTTIAPDSLEIRPDVLRRINSDFEGMMGVYCEIAMPGELAVGDPVELL
jgi:uncharacterized protein YcbX